MNLQSTQRLLTGNQIPILGLGTWQLKNDTAGTVAKALQLGYPMIDTSGDYGTQPGIGEGIKLSNIARQNFYLVTKVEEDEDAYEAVRRNLAELQLGYADLILIHRPPASSFGEELWRGLIKAKNEGLTRDIGVSNYSIDLLQSLIDATGEVPVVNQIEWSPFGHSLEMLDYCSRNKILIQAYSPLTRGERLGNTTLADIAQKHDKTPAQVILRWNLQLGTIALPKANQAQHLEENLDIFDFNLSTEDMSTLGSLNEQYSALGEKLGYL